MMTSIGDLRLVTNEEVKAVLGKASDAGDSAVVAGSGGSAIVLTNERVIFIGEHFHYINGDTSRAIHETESVPLVDFLGAGYIRKRSRRSLYSFVSIGIVLTLLTQFASKLKKWGFSFGFLSSITAMLVVIFAVLFGVYVFRRYRLFEVAFIGRRLCVHERHFDRVELQRFIEAIYQVKRGQL